jgi:hypothetical protein
MPANPKDKVLADVKRSQQIYERELDRARDARRKSFQRARKAGLSLREIGDAAGIHHSRVAEIVRND